MLFKLNLVFLRQISIEKNVQILKHLMEYGTISEINNVFISIALFSIGLRL